MVEKIFFSVQYILNATNFVFIFAGTEMDENSVRLCNYNNNNTDSAADDYYKLASASANDNLRSPSPSLMQCLCCNEAMAISEIY